MIERRVQAERGTLPMLRMAVADDSPTILRVFSRLVQAVGAERVAVIDQYSSGEKIISAVKENPGKYNLVITDGKMGLGKNGVDVARELGGILPVYISSGGMSDFDIDDPKLLEKTGFSGALSKPYNMKDVQVFLSLALKKLAQSEKK